MKLNSIDFPGFQSIYVAAQSLLRKIGIDMQIQTLDSAAWVAATHRGDHHLSMTGVTASDPSSVALLFHSKNYNGYDWSRYKNADFDKMWDDAAIELNEQKRADLYEKIHLQIMNNALIQPIHQLIRLNFVTAKVKGVKPDSRGVYQWLYDVHIEPK